MNKFILAGIHAHHKPIASLQKIKTGMLYLIKNRAVRVLLLVFFLFGTPAQKSLSQRLPKPSGKFGIGFHRLEWTDTSRTEILAPDNSKRRIIADIWYPAQTHNRATVPYLDTVAIFSAFGSKGLESILGPEGAAVARSGIMQTHARQGAGFHSGIKTAPVIFFSHGMGLVSQLYTAQIEDLVSHGYVVAALSHTHDAWLVSFADGASIPFETKQRSAAGNSEEQHITYENTRIEWWAEDIRFALDQLTLINSRRDSSIPFAGHLDLNRVGAMGHSAGGRAAARACQLDTRLKSCADQDGVAMMQPFYPGTDGLGMKQPFLLFERVRNLAPDENDAAELNMTLSELNTLVSKLRQAKEKALRATGGSYHVLLQFDSSTHMSFSDLPLLQAKNEAAVAAAQRILLVTCRYTREFFDKTLRTVPAPLLEGGGRLKYIELLKYYPNTGQYDRD